MSVAKYKRKESKFEVINKFNRIRKYTTFYILRDFGIKGNLNEAEVAFLEEERFAIIDLMRKTSVEINLANDIYITNYVEYEQRRLHQDNAIGYMQNIYCELQYVIDIFKDKEKASACKNNIIKKYSKNITEEKEAKSTEKQDKEKVSEKDNSVKDNKEDNNNDGNNKNKTKKKKKMFYTRISININKYKTLLQMMGEELILLRAWRKKENPVGAKYRKEANNLFEMNEYKIKIQEEILDIIVDNIDKPQDVKDKFKKNMLKKINDGETK